MNSEENNTNNSINNNTNVVGTENSTNNQSTQESNPTNNLLQKIIELIGEENVKKVIDSDYLFTTKSDLQQIVENVGDQIIDSIGGKEIYDSIIERKTTVVDSNKLTVLMTQVQQNSVGLEQSTKIINELQTNLKDQRKLIKRFYQLEAVTLGHKQALEAILKCFDTASSWPTIEVYTEAGWSRGSVNYNLHNAIMLAKAATQSENLIVIEKHLSSLNGVIKTLNQDILDMQKTEKTKFARCKNCQRIKEAGLLCHSCGRPDEISAPSSGDDDDE